MQPSDVKHKIEDALKRHAEVEAKRIRVSVSGAGNSANTIRGNLVNDAYCGVAYVTGDRVQDNIYLNTLYETLNGDNYPDAFPPAVEPGQAALAPQYRIQAWRRAGMDQ